MEVFLERLTTTEAAVAAGVSLPQINRVIDEQILPDDWYSTFPTRTLRTDACLLISFYFGAADRLTATAHVKRFGTRWLTAAPGPNGSTTPPKTES